ncbi:hypothetical protein [Pelagicoccus sp. SDUM812003]|uniref:hypothetical protein n=1 Tax=Pelagicoccus sp. SDUM812003 TaxID=3041267 RepID=UPI00280EDFFF|nr:hypothetical protein [Pelagicoccus sp. SDUM812003]MDQ8205456.1 hypothetical protein [Pelagicoccus sp. SDUM812003]
MKVISKGDWDGFFGLGLNNFINLLLIISLSQSVLGFSAEFIATRVLPGMAIGLLFGNLFYAWQARRLAERTGRDDVCALPYGINLLPIFFFTFYVMLPAQQMALADGASQEEANRIAWIAGVLACVGSGLVEVVGSYLVHHLRKVASRAAMLSALAAVGIFFIAADYAFRAYAFPLVGLPTLFLTLYFYYGSVRIRWNIPGGLIVLLAGVSIAWGSHWLGLRSPVGGLGETNLSLGMYWPFPYGFEAFAEIGYMLSFAAVILPMGLINVIGSMQALESAVASGDDFPAKPSLLINGWGSVLAGVLGSPYPTTLYIGHPGWKAIGARSGYSLINGVAMSLLCLTGAIGLLSELIPIEAGMAILIWIGFTISTQAFSSVPKAHIPAVVAGLLPGIGAFAALIAKRVLGAVGYGSSDQPYSEGLLADMAAGNFYAEGVFALEQGWLYASIVFASVMVAIVEKRPLVAMGWLAASAGLSLTGVMHRFEVIETDVTAGIGPAWTIALGYLLAVIVFAVFRYVFVAQEQAAKAPVECKPSREKPQTLPLKHAIRQIIRKDIRN